ncbi:hypothetical protein ACIBJF_42865 [Streptomyces sp. NPDC050743]|uniref:hypothetical protein n=1 Tax=Streptomyces sp. NPDC050743 TaxID=3365634 RepID=UPI0037B93D1B
MTYTHVGNAKHRRSALGRVSAVSGEWPPRDTAHSEERQWPADTQVWHWAESAAVSGYGPSASSFF